MSYTGLPPFYVAAGLFAVLVIKPYYELHLEDKVMTANNLQVRRGGKTALKRYGGITLPNLAFLFATVGAITTLSIGDTTLAVITPYGLKLAKLGFNALDVVMTLSIETVVVAGVSVAMLWIGNVIRSRWVARAVRQNGDSNRALLNDPNTIDPD